MYLLTVSALPHQAVHSTSPPSAFKAPYFRHLPSVPSFPVDQHHFFAASLHTSSTFQKRTYRPNPRSPPFNLPFLLTRSTSTTTHLLVLPSCVLEHICLRASTHMLCTWRVSWMFRILPRLWPTTPATTPAVCVGLALRMWIYVVLHARSTCHVQATTRMPNLSSVWCRSIHVPASSFVLPLLPYPPETSRHDKPDPAYSPPDTAHRSDILILRRTARRPGRGTCISVSAS